MADLPPESSDSSVEVSVIPVALPDLPTAVGDEETVVRVVKSPFHLNPAKTRLKRQAFHPVPGERDISVIRQQIGDGAVKNSGVEQVSGGTYEGLAAGHVGVLRERVNADFEDKPEEFRGHAHMRHPFDHQKQGAAEPLPPDVLFRQDTYYDALLAHFAYQDDPQPEVAGWAGGPLGRIA